MEFDINIILPQAPYLRIGPARAAGVEAHHFALLDFAVRGASDELGFQGLAAFLSDVHLHLLLSLLLLTAGGERSVTFVLLAL